MWRNQSGKGGVQPGEEAALQIAAAFAKSIHSPKELWPPVFIIMADFLPNILVVLPINKNIIFS